MSTKLISQETFSELIVETTKNVEKVCQLLEEQYVKSYKYVPTNKRNVMRFIIKLELNDRYNNLEELISEIK